MVLTLKPGLELTFLKAGGVIFQDSISKKAFSLKTCSELTYEVLQSLKAGVEQDRLPKDQETEAAQVLQFLKDKAWITEKMQNPFKNESRERLFSYLHVVQAQGAEKVLTDLTQVKILILGCGGTGSAVAQHLLAMGLRRFVLVDDDRVQASNLNRQAAFSEESVGQFKTAALKEFLCHRNSEVRIEIENLRVTSAKDVSDLIGKYTPQFVFCGADQPAVLCHKWVAQACDLAHVPCIFGGVGITEGSWGPLLSEKIAFLNYIKNQEQLESTYETSLLTPVEGSLSTTNMIIASMMAHDVFSFVAKIGRPLSFSKKLKMDFTSMQIATSRSFE